MRQILYYYYNVNFEIIDESTDIYLLRYREELFAFKRLEIDEESLKGIITILNNYHINYHHIIINSKNELISTFQNKNYCLIKIEQSLKNRWMDFSIYEIDYHIIDLGIIWEQRIDYYMKSLSELGITNLLTLSLFNYYIGMSENAIAIVNRLKNKDSNFKRVLAHKRVRYPFDYIKYYDPTEMIIDVRIRDYSEYLKSKIESDDVILDNELRYIRKINYSNDEANILLARLLYPSYYFDRLDKFLEHEITEDELNKSIDLIYKYEHFLSNIYKEMSSMYELYIIDWIKK